jgi:hypothetical protein
METFFMTDSFGQAMLDEPSFDDCNSTAELLDSLEGYQAAECDLLKAACHDADAVDVIQREAASLRLTTVPNGRSAVVTITATITTDSSEKVLDVFKVDPADVKKRNEYAQRLAGMHPAIEATNVERQLMELAARLAQSRQEPQTPACLTSAELLAQTPQAVWDEARAMLEDPNLKDRIVADIQAMGVAGEDDLILTLVLVGTSRLLPNPVKAIVSSDSSTGKTITVQHTTRCFPPEVLIEANSITAQVLFYMGENNPDALVHKLVVCGERKKQQGKAQADHTSAIRQLLSDGRITQLRTDTSVHPPVAKQIVVNGPIAYIETTTSSADEMFPEDTNRCLLLATDDGEQQTRRVIKRIAAIKSGAATVDGDAIQERHHALQRMLQQRPIVIPFAEPLAEKYVCERPEARRAFGQLCGMIEASALLHQFQRQLDADGCIIATLADYELAARLCLTPLARLLGGRISNAAIEFHGRLRDRKLSQFNTREAVDADGRSKQAVTGWLKELVEIGAVELVTKHNGPNPAVWRLTAMSKKEVSGGFRLPTVAELAEADQSQP